MSARFTPHQQRLWDWLMTLPESEREQALKDHNLSQNLLNASVEHSNRWDEVGRVTAQQIEADWNKRKEAQP